MWLLFVWTCRVVWTLKEFNNHTCVLTPTSAVRTDSNFENSRFFFFAHFFMTSCRVIASHYGLKCHDIIGHYIFSSLLCLSHRHSTQVIRALGDVEMLCRALKTLCSSVCVVMRTVASDEIV